MAAQTNVFGTRATLAGPGWTVAYHRLPALAEQAITNLDRLPVTIKILLENVIRHCDGQTVTQDQVLALARWSVAQPADQAIPFLPARVLLQDFTGVPAVVDLASMRSAIARLGGDPERINPMVPVDLVIDHSIQVDAFGSQRALAINSQYEYERNRERYTLLRWAQTAYQGFHVVPPSTGIVHQVNLEYLATVVHQRREGQETMAYPDTLVGTDSHTTMVNGLGVLGWGVGGIEAEAVMLNQPLYLPYPRVVGVRLSGALPAGTTATDLVLTITQVLRRHGVVDKLVEFTGPGLSHLSLPDRATLGNMSPEYGATAAFFPVDQETLRYLRLSGRSEALVSLVERYTKEQQIFRTDEMPEPQFSELLDLDLSTVEPCLAGPRRPQDRVPLRLARSDFRAAFPERFTAPDSPPVVIQEERFDWEGGTVNEAQEPSKPEVAVDPVGKTVDVTLDGIQTKICEGSVAIAAITSCTNTSNPAVMVAAGLLAKKAVELGLDTKPYVKTSLAPGSRVVTDYLRNAGLMPYLEALRFHLVGYGCTTCIGNSGPLPAPVAQAVKENEIVVAAVLSGNRNFEGRIHPLVRASYLASPPLVVAFALAGTVDIDLTKDPLGQDSNGRPIYLRDVWPTNQEVQAAIEANLTPELFTKTYSNVFEGDEQWRALPAGAGSLYAWDPDSTYVQDPPYFVSLTPELEPLRPIKGARAIAVLGDSITTDHISPAGAIPAASPAGRYLIDHGVQPKDFNSYGARRGNHQVMLRGTFGNVRLRNALTPDREGDWTIHLPTATVMRIFDAAELYREAGTPLLVIAGKEYGSGSSRDWAAKGPLLLGVRAVLAESFERIHRSNLVGMGILPLQFKSGQNRASLDLSGRETYDVEGLADGLQPQQELTIRVRRHDGRESSFQAIVRIDNAIEVEYLGNGGILPLVLRRLLRDE